MSFGKEYLIEVPQPETQSDDWEYWNTYLFIPGKAVWGVDGVALPPWEETTRVYDLITRSGKRYIGRPKYLSNLDASSMPEWIVTGPPDADAKYLGDIAVLAWKLHTED